MKKNPYFDLPGVSSSVIGWVLPESGGSREMYEHFQSNEPKVEGPAVDIGSALHKFIEIPDKFKVQIVTKPGPATKRVLDMLLEDPEVTSLDYMFSAKVLDAVKARNFQPAWKEDTRVKKIIEEGASYFDAVRKQDEVTMLLGEDEARTVEICSAQLKKHSERIFAPEIAYADGVEIHKEFVIQFEIHGVQCKSLIDRLILDHKNKQFQIEDLKTTGTMIPQYEGYDIPGLAKCEGEIMNRHIYRQMAFYTLAVQAKFLGYVPMNYPLILVQEAVAPFRYKEIRITDAQMELGVRRITEGIRIIKAIDVTL